MRFYISSLLLFIACLCCSETQAQLNRYLVSLTDKNNSPYSLQNPSAYLSNSALERRVRYQISIDSSDLPVNPTYIESIRAIANVRILNVSKWFNQLTIETTDPSAIAAMQALPFVQNIVAFARSGRIPVSVGLSNLNTSPLLNPFRTDIFQYGQSSAQMQLHQTPFLHDHGFSGQNMRIAILDAGFYHYDELPTFDSIRTNGQIQESWDFVDLESSVQEDDAHGMQCLSTIAANMPGTFVGAAPKSAFYLYRTEDVFSEYPIEEFNIACAAERADSAGVDVCSISLGYTTFSDPSLNHSYADMNGTTCISSKAIKKGATKGMLFVVAAGNEGNSSWHYISAPADADAALAVGAVNSAGQVAGFSSYGPSSDGQTKPNVASHGWGTTIANTSNGQPTTGSGTSFACPNMAGVVTCLWQAFKEKKQQEIVTVLQQSGSLATAPNYRMGYGIPNAKKAFTLLQKNGFSHQENFSQCSTNITCMIKSDPSMQLVVERKFPDESTYTQVAMCSPTDTWDYHTFNIHDDLSNRNYSRVNYRYRMVIDSDTTYILDSAIVYFLIPCTPINPGSDQPQFSITPNPAGSTLTVNLNRIESTEVTWLIYNQKGQVVFKRKETISSGSSTRSFEIQSLSTGPYLMKFIDATGHAETLPFLKN